MRRFLFLLLLAGVGCSAESQSVDWPAYGGGAGGTKYSILTQIDRDSVSRLQIAWTWEAGEKPVPGPSVAFSGEFVRPGRFEGTPIVVDDTMYVSTPYSRVVALDARSGAEIWSYDPGAYRWGQLPRVCGFCHRGVAMWRDGDERRIFINSRWRLIALDAATGEPIESFGDGGEINLTDGLIWEVNRLHSASAQRARPARHSSARGVPRWATLARRSRGRTRM